MNLDTLMNTLRAAFIACAVACTGACDFDESGGSSPAPPCSNYTASPSCDACIQGHNNTFQQGNCCDNAPGCQTVWCDDGPDGKILSCVAG